MEESSVYKIFSEFVFSKSLKKDIKIVVVFTKNTKQDKGI
jgi:hypothetical protein